MNKEDEKNVKNRLVYNSPYVKDKEVSLTIGSYANNGRIHLRLTTMEDGNEEMFGDVTVNISAPAPAYCGYLDTRNLSGVEKFVKEHKLGEATKFRAFSNLSEYPLYMFNVDRLRELCPEQMAAYEQSIGAVKKSEHKKSR